MEILVHAQLQQLMQIPLNITGNANTTMPSIPAITLANLFGDTVSTLVFIALAIGFIVRTHSEYLEKLLNGEITKFDRKYAITAIAGFLITVPIIMASVPEGIKVFATFAGTWGIAGGLVGVAALGYGINHAANKTTSLLGHFMTPKNMDEITPNSMKKSQNKGEDSDKTDSVSSSS